MIATAPLDTRDAELAVIGAVLLSDQLVEPLTVEVGLRAEHFSLPVLAQAWRAVLKLTDQGRPVDEFVLRDAMGTMPAEADRVLADAAVTVPTVGNVREYGRIVVDRARWRRRARELSRALEATQARDEDAYLSAEAGLRDDVETDDADALDPSQAAAKLVDYLEREPDAGDVVPTPWHGVNRLLAGGFRPGATYVVSGWTSIGKTGWVIGALSHAAKHVGPDRCAIWTNEMTATEILLREAARETSATLTQLLDRKLTAKAASEVMALANRWPYTVINAAGWPAEKIARDLRRRRPRMAVVDLFNQLPGVEKTDGADAAIQQLTAAAAVSGCTLLLCAQLNQERNKGAQRPAPVLRDLRGTGQLANNPAGVIFVHRDDEEIGEGVFEPGDLGHVRVAKGRMHQLGMVPVIFDGAHQRFTEAMPR